MNATLFSFRVVTKLFHVIAAGLALLATIAANAEVLWQIGQTDRDNRDFALAPKGYEQFREDGFFVVGRSDPKRDWPYVHPGPQDSWAGGSPHTFSIAFGMKNAPAGGDCNPQIEIRKDALAPLLDRTRISTLSKLGAKVLHADSEDRQHGNVAANAIDGDPDTIWHTRWQPSNDPMPHDLTVDLGREVALRAVTYLPRQDMVNGRIADCEIFCSDTPDAWAAPCAKAKWRNTDQLQTVSFSQPMKARYVKLVAMSEVNRNPFASIAELDVVLAEK